MRFSTYINSKKCIEWGLNANQGALFDLLNQVSSWADPVVVNDKVFYWVSRNEVITQLPLFYSKADTVYRHFKDLASKKLINYIKKDGKDLISLTEKGKEWNEYKPKEEDNNSEINPNNSEIDPNNDTKLGNKSEKTRIQIRKSSEIDPTYNITNNNITNDNNTPLPPKGELANARPEQPKKRKRNTDINYSAIAEAYNRCVKNSGKKLSLIANPDTLSDKRKQAIKKLAIVFRKRDATYEHQHLVEYFTDYFTEFLRLATPFYFGEGSRKWKADFEYILRESTFDKVIEDNL